VFDVIFSTKSSFTRIRNCFTVFHKRDDDTGSEVAEKGHDAEHHESADGEDVGEHRKDGTAPTDELEVLDEKKEQPTSEQKPRRGTNVYKQRLLVIFNSLKTLICCCFSSFGLRGFMDMILCREPHGYETISNI